MTVTRAGTHCLKWTARARARQYYNPPGCPCLQGRLSRAQLRQWHNQVQRLLIQLESARASSRSICIKMRVLVLSVALMRAQQANACLMLCVGADESHAPDAGVTRVDPHDVVQVCHPRRDTCLICRLSRSTESLFPSPRATVREGEGEREGKRERGRERGRQREGGREIL